MSNDGCDIGWVEAEGDHRQIGRALGAAGRDALHAHLVPSEIWKTVTDAVHAPLVQRLARETKARFPHIWSELEGLAEGLELPLDPVFAWNCRGDLLTSVPDGCTTVQLPGTEPIIAHNEDGLPFFRGFCFMAAVRCSTASTFTSFCYPGSLPGHTFAVTGAGLVQAVNNLRLLRIVPKVPRMVLGRAVLDAPDIDSALDLLRAAPPSGGFHVTLAQRGIGRLVSVEFGTGTPAIWDVETPSVHANHALHLANGMDEQVVTQSSRDRQDRGTSLLSAGSPDALTLLLDQSGPGLPIHREDPDDPDHENTLATAVLRVKKERVEWSVYDKFTNVPVYRGKEAEHRPSWLRRRTSGSDASDRPR